MPDHCAICLEDLETGSNVMALPPCGHEFHTTCIVSSLRQSGPRCPICRAGESEEHDAPGIHMHLHFNLDTRTSIPEHEVLTYLQEEVQRREPATKCYSEARRAFVRTKANLARRWSVRAELRFQTAIAELWHLFCFKYGQMPRPVRWERAQPSARDRTAFTYDDQGTLHCLMRTSSLNDVEVAPIDRSFD